MPTKNRCRVDALESRQHEITESDWQRAGVIMKMSDIARKWLHSEIDEKKRSENLSRGRAEGEREIVKGEVIDEEKHLIGAMAERIVEKLKSEDGQSVRDLKRSLSAKSTRDRFDKTVRYVVKQKMVRCEDFTAHNGQAGVRLWLP